MDVRDAIEKAIGSPVMLRREEFNFYCGDYDIYTWHPSHLRVYYRGKGNAEDELTRLQLRLSSGRIKTGVRPYLEVPRAGIAQPDPC